MKTSHPAHHYASFRVVSRPRKILKFLYAEIAHQYQEKTMSIGNLPQSHRIQIQDHGQRNHAQEALSPTLSSKSQIAEQIPPDFSISCFGRFEVRHSGTPIHLCTNRKG